jgi:preprotein translocase subunit SecA
LEDEEVAELAPLFRSGGHQPVIHAKGLEEKKRQPAGLTYSAPSETGDSEVRKPAPARSAARSASGQGSAAPSAASSDEDRFASVGRNMLCPCGSGKKYKRCHGAPGGPTGQTSRVG